LCKTPITEYIASEEAVLNKVEAMNPQWLGFFAFQMEPIDAPATQDGEER